MHFGQKIVNGLACIKASGLSFFFSFLFFFSSAKFDDTVVYNVVSEEDVDSMA